MYVPAAQEPISARRMVFVPLNVALPLVSVRRSLVEPNSKTMVALASERFPVERVMVRPTPSARLIVVPLEALRSEVVPESAEAPLRTTVPPVTDTAPLLVFVPFKVSVPVADFVKFPAPWSDPLKVVVLASATVRVCPLAIVTLPPAAPPPCREAIVSLVLTLKATPEVFARVTVPVSVMAAPPLIVSVPALIVVAPV